MPGFYFSSLFGFLMKQRITPKQLAELSEKGKKRLRKWWIKRHLKNVDEIRIAVYGKGDKKELQDNHDKKMAKEEYQKYGKFLSIGQMIEFLGDKFVSCNLQEVKGGKKLWFVMIDRFRSAGEKEPRDALWQAVKGVLEK